MNKLMLKKCVTAMVLAGTVMLPPALWATNHSDSFVIQKIELTGVAPSLYKAVEQRLPVKVGDTFKPAQSDQVITALYATGYFDNVSVWEQGNTLVIHTHQRPTIAEIAITGNEAIKTDQLNQVLLNADLQAGDMLNRNVLRQIKQSLLDEYYAQGKYAVQITTQVESLPRDRVKVDIKISEGLTAKIERITIVGAHAFSQKQLIQQLDISTPGFWAFFTGSDKYTQQNMVKSLEALNSYYTDHGYINFRINSTEVSLSPDKKHIYITVNVSEGDKYTFSGYALDGDLIVSKDQLTPLIDIQKGNVFSRKQVVNAEKAIADKLGDMGYAFATANPVPTLDNKTKTVFITFHINPGRRYYVRFINFTGNTSTNDQVLRQQMRYMEGSPYDYSQVQNSKVRLLRYYSFLSNATEKTVPVPGTNNQVDTNYTVKEQSANQVSASIGYSQLYKVILGLGLNMPNVFGTGNIFGINTQISQPYKSISFNYTEPYFTMSGISQTIAVYLNYLNTDDTVLASYSTNSVGTTLNYSIPINDTDAITYGGGLDHTQLEEPTGATSETVSKFISTYQNDFNTYTLNTGWSRNSTNRAYFPTQGTLDSISATVAGPGSTLTWYKILTSGAWFYPTSQRTNISIGGGVDYGQGYGRDTELPFYQNFTGGGWGSVRGYTSGSLGPLDTISCDDPTYCTPGSPYQGQALGGNLSVYSTANIYFPVPFAWDNNNVRWGLFVDAGNIYSTYLVSTAWNNSADPRYPNFGNMLYSTGIELEWQIPHIGPLAISLAKPLNEPDNSEINIFQFSVGGYFNN